MRFPVIILLFLAGSLHAQTKKNPPSKKPAVATETVAAAPDTIDEREVTIRSERRFAVYNKRAISRKENRMKLCIQLVHKDTVLAYCINDSLTREPEVTKVLFERQDGDTNYVMVYVDAWTKDPNKPSCDAGKETKLFFFRWHLKSNQAMVKQKSINSCQRAITNMTKEPIDKWDGQSVLNVQYHRGGTKFIDMKFDPANYKAGFVSSEGDK